MTSPHDREDRLLNEVRDALSSHEPGAERLNSMRRHVQAAAVRGGTTLRDVPARSRWWVPAVGAAAAVVVGAVLVWPTVDRRTTVSAAEILGRSRAALSTAATGTEVLTYDLSVGGILAEFLPAEQSGQFTVQETIDHDRPGRYRLLKIGPGGEVVGGIGDDPLSGIRTRYLRAHGRGYLLRFAGADPAGLSPAAVKRGILEALITLMQAEGNQLLRETTCEGEPCYDVTVPDSAGPADGFVSLDRGRALVTAAEARLVEFAAAGRVAGRPFEVSFTLRDRRVLTSSAAEDFELTARPGDIVLEGNASSNPMWDVIERALAAVPQQSQR